MISKCALIYNNYKIVILVMNCLQIILRHELFDDTNIIKCLLKCIIPILLYNISFTNLNLEKNLFVNKHIKISRVITGTYSLLENCKMLVENSVHKLTS